MLDAPMNRTQRIVLVIYCFLLAYCCTWIPWYVTFLYGADGVQRKSSDVVYSLVWVAPTWVPAILQLQQWS